MPRSDRALRRVVAELADAAPDDVAAILDALPAEQRGTVEALLDAYAGKQPDEVRQAPEAEASAAATNGFSPWLAARLAAPVSVPGARSEAFELTPAAHAALVAAAAPFAAASRPASRGRSLTGRVAGLFARRA